MSVPFPAGTIPVRKKIPGPDPEKSGTRIVITGKGGVGKTTLTALLAILFAQNGKRVLAVDGDPQQNLAATLGIPPEEAGHIIPVSESVQYLREKTGAGPDVSPGGLLLLNPDVSDVVERFSVPVVPDLRLLVMGGIRRAGSGCLCPEYTLLAAIIRHMRLLPDDIVILDTPAGLEHFGRAIAEGFSCAVVVADPSYNALAVARESAMLARELGIERIILVVNRVSPDQNLQKIAGTAGNPDLFSRILFLPFDTGATGTEPAIAPLIETGSGFIRNARILAETISRG
ncbi:MAG: AAA family ATPase [Methanoregula sp.]|nr:AAA family ATPase [Methanoregula sp.]